MYTTNTNTPHKLQPSKTHKHFFLISLFLLLSKILVYVLFFTQLTFVVTETLLFLWNHFHR